jgi:hypothetical protein
MNNYSYIIVSFAFFAVIIIFVFNFNRLNKFARLITGKLFNVEITRGFNGTWKVISSTKSNIAKFGIELLQLVWILCFFVVFIVLEVGVFFLLK